MKHLSARLTVALAVVTTQSAHGQESPLINNGSDLLGTCSKLVQLLDQPSRSGRSETERLTDGIAGLSCGNFLQGITHLNLFYQAYLVKERAAFCLPLEGISNGQAVRIVLKYLQDHPEELHYEPVILTVNAFRRAFPCGR